MATLVAQPSDTDSSIAASTAALHAIREAIQVPADWQPGCFVGVDRMAECVVAPSASELSDGVAQSSDGTILVATSVPFEGVETAALAWWFAQGCPGTEEVHTALPVHERALSAPALQAISTNHAHPTSVCSISSQPLTSTTMLMRNGS